MTAREIYCKIKRIYFLRFIDVRKKNTFEKIKKTLQTVQEAGRKVTDQTAQVWQKIQNTLSSKPTKSNTAEFDDAKILDRIEPKVYESNDMPMSHDQKLLNSILNSPPPPILFEGHNILSQALADSDQNDRIITELLKELKVRIEEEELENKDKKTSTLGQLFQRFNREKTTQPENLSQTREKIIDQEKQLWKIIQSMEKEKAHYPLTKEAASNICLLISSVHESAKAIRTIFRERLQNLNKNDQFTSILSIDEKYITGNIQKILENLNKISNLARTYLEIASSNQLDSSEAIKTLTILGTSIHAMAESLSNGEITWFNRNRTADPAIKGLIFHALKRAFKATAQLKRAIDLEPPKPKKNKKSK